MLLIRDIHLFVEGNYAHIWHQKRFVNKGLKQKKKNRALCVSGEGMCPPNVTQGLVPLTILQYRNTIKMQRVKRVNNISYFVRIFWIHKSASLNLLDTFPHTCLCQVTQTVCFLLSIANAFHVSLNCTCSHLLHAS